MQSTSSQTLCTSTHSWSLPRRLFWKAKTDAAGSDPYLAWEIVQQCILLLTVSQSTATPIAVFAHFEFVRPVASLTKDHCFLASKLTFSACSVYIDTEELQGIRCIRSYLWQPDSQQQSERTPLFCRSLAKWGNQLSSWHAECSNRRRKLLEPRCMLATITLQRRCRCSAVVSVPIG